MSETRKLGPATEAWLRQHIQPWASLRDRAVAAGLVEPKTAAITDAAAKSIAQIAGIRRRVARRLPNSLPAGAAVPGPGRSRG